SVPIKRTRCKPHIFQGERGLEEWLPGSRPSSMVGQTVRAGVGILYFNPVPANGATDDPYDNEGYSSKGDNSTCEGSSNIRDSNTLHNRIRNTRVQRQR